MIHPNQTDEELKALYLAWMLGAELYFTARQNGKTHAYRDNSHWFSDELTGILKYKKFWYWHLK